MDLMEKNIEIGTAPMFRRMFPNAGCPRNIKIWALSLTILLCSAVAFSQSDVELKMQLLTADQIAEVTLDIEPVLDWIKKVYDEVENYLKNEEGDKEVLIIITLHKDKEPTIDIGARPGIEKSSIDSLSANISKHEAPKTKITDYSFAIIASINDGCSEAIDYSPPVSLPKYKEYLNYKELDLSGKKDAMQTWIKDEVIPVIMYYETIVDPMFEGVLSVGEILKQEKYNNSEIDNLTDNHPDYWRAVMEMSPGNQLIPFTKVCMHIAKGEFDKATRLLFAVNLFSDKSTLPAIFHDEISAKLGLLMEDLDLAINEGITLHDNGKYKEAVAHYENLLKIFPKSAWLNYELYYSKTAEMNLDESDAEWDRAKEIIYSCDPMYYMDVRARSGKEGYLLFRRREVNSLFQSEDSLKADFVRYADIALDLENYGFAAQLYWLILNYFSEEDYNNRNILAHYLYCLDKLGDKVSINNFQGDFPKEFENIENERRKIMEESPVYNAFERDSAHISSRREQ
jgi:tetratricopeptide (TPR) repeat protein